MTVKGRRVGGFDVSWGQTSETACAAWEVTDDLATLYEVWVEELDDIQDVVAFVEMTASQQNFEAFAVDGIGFGAGPVQLLEKGKFGDRVFAFIASEKPSRDWERSPECSKTRNCTCEGCLVDRRFANYKTRVLWEMRLAAYKGRVRVTPHPRLLEELPKYQLTRVGDKWKSVDPKKSPDVADAAVAGYSLAGDFEQSFWMGH